MDYNLGLNMEAIMDKLDFSDNDKTKRADSDESRDLHSLSKTSRTESLLNQQTIRSESFDSEKTIDLVKEESSDGKSSSLFGKEDMQKKLQEELADVPEVEQEDMQSVYLSKLISKPFSHRTEDERLKINRNFLRDAEPFSIERLMEDLKGAPDELKTGYPSLDKRITIPQHRLTLIASRPGHGKTVFMLNILINLCLQYPNKHFLYYSYGESRQDIEIKLVNMCSETPFGRPPAEGITNNFERWKYEFKTQDTGVLKKKMEINPEYKGLSNFLEISPRIHVVDANYNILDLIDSIKAFNSTLSIGATFIDYLQAVRPQSALPGLSRGQQANEIANLLVDLGNETHFPMIVSAQLAMGEKNIPEYDGLSLDFLKDAGDPEQIANLIIGLQNYSKSEFIGSNVNTTFTSRFYELSFNKAEKMPATFKDKHPNTVILAKTLLNRGGPLVETELLFNKWLMRVSDLKDERPLEIK
jgi:replicative DNA helicase